jgi:hypothetical protein
MSVAIEPGARRVGQGVFQESFELLMAGIEHKIVDYWRRFGTEVVELGAVGWTPEGRHLCEALGLQRRGVDCQNNPIFTALVKDAVQSQGRLGGLIFRLKERYSKAR